MSAVPPASISDYLAQLRTALAGNDPALVQDALFDAEEYLRGELAEHPHESEATVIARVASSYGAPGEVAEIYRDTEARVVQALRTPPVIAKPRSLAGRFFGVASDARTWGALFYMLLALATGIVYFTLVVTGLSLSLGLMILIIGVPFALLYLGLTRVLSLVEGRLVEVMLGQRMPRRPLYSNRALPLRERISQMLRDPRTWSTQLYMVLMLPLGITYFTIAVTLFTTSLALIAAGALYVLHAFGLDFPNNVVIYWWPAWSGPLVVLAGVLLLFGSLHLARGLGRMHGALAKALLVQGAARVA